MKHIAIILLAVLPALVGRAQDTVPYMRGNIFYNVIPDWKKPAYPGFPLVVGNGCGIQTKEMYTGKDPIKIYGVAAVMMTPLDMVYIPDTLSAELAQEWWDLHYSEYHDTSLTESYEYLGVYLAQPDSSLAVQREVMVHRLYDTPSYYVSTGQSAYYNPDFTFPVYEKYFDSSIAVQDTFYIGTTMHSADQYVVHNHVGFLVLAYSNPSSSSDLYEYHVYKRCIPTDSSWVWPDRAPWRMENKRVYMMFPILTPDPNAPDDPGDTPGDTTGVSQADMVSLYVTVQPNPATEEAQVLSSFGLQRIEAYTGDGRCILSQKASGLQAVLDVRGWASGTYLLRVTTPMGTTTKKLLVR